jgi:hypothetical protein
MNGSRVVARDDKGELGWDKTNGMKSALDSGYRAGMTRRFTIIVIRPSTEHVNLDCRVSPSLEDKNPGEPPEVDTQQ